MLVWKDLVQSGRSLRFSQVLRWGWVFILESGDLSRTRLAGEVVIGGVWAVSLGTLTTDRLRSDLARWWLLRSLPLRTLRPAAALLGPACGLGLLLGWLALALVSPPASFGWLAAALLPFLVVAAALGSAHDILDHARARVLLTPAQGEENVPRQDIQGALTVLVSVGIPLALLVWGSSLSNGLFLALLSLPIAALVAVLLFRSVCLVVEVLSELLSGQYSVGRGQGVGLRCPGVFPLKTLPYLSCSMPRCSVYQRFRDFGSFDLKKRPPMPVTRFFILSSL